MREVPLINDVDLVFGNIKHLPAWEDIPKEFKNVNNPNKWAKTVTRWFFSGLPPNTEFHPKEGVNGKDAFRAVSAILRSFAPKHEHKQAGAALLLSEWFEDVVIPEEAP